MARFRKSVPPNYLPDENCPTLLSQRKVKHFEKWFKENILSEITDVLGRKIKIDAEKFGHLSTSEGKDGKRRFSQQRARQLNLMCSSAHIRNDSYIYNKRRDT